MEEVKKIIDIQFNGKESIADVKKEISQLKKELDECAVGSEAAKDKSLELAQAQEKLKAAMKGAITETGKLDKSYNGLVTRMKMLKDAQKQVDLSTKAGRKQFVEYSKEINKINDELKSLDASNGVFGRNVGNYANSIKDAFSGMGGAVTGVFNSINAGLKALCTNPWVAVLTAILLALKQLADAFKRNDEAMLKANKVMNRFKSVVVAVQRAFDRLVKWIVDGSGIITKAFTATWDFLKKMYAWIEPVVDKILGFYKTLLNAYVKFIQFQLKIADKAVIATMTMVARLQHPFDNKAFQETKNEYLKHWQSLKDGVERVISDVWENIKDFGRQFIEDWKEANAIQDEIDRREAALARQHVENTRKLAENNRKIADLNAKAADREKYSVEQREKYLKESAALQKQNIDIEASELREQLNIARLKHSLNQSNTADIQEEADIEADLINKLAEKDNVERNLLQNQRALIKESAQANKESISQQIKYIEEELAITEKGTDEHLALVKEKLRLEKQAEELEIKDKIKDKKKQEEELAALTAKYQLKEEQAEKQHQIDLRDIRLQEMQNDADLLDRGSQAYYDAIVAIKEYALESIIRLDSETEEQFNARVIKATKELQLAQQKAEQFAKDAEYKAAKNKAGEIGLEKGNTSLEYYQAELDAAKLYYENLQQLQDESNEDYKARQIKALNDVHNAEKSLNDKRISNYTALSNALTDIMSTVADAWGDSIQAQVDAGKISQKEGEKQFENVKALEIAITTIQMLTGIASAMALTYTTHSGWWDWAIAAAQAASIAASGIANIVKIKNTTLGNSASAGGASASTPSFQLPSLESYQPNYTQNLTGASDVDNLSKSIKESMEDLEIKAVVVESEITAAQKRATTRRNESTW